jgi:hypothetical protein
MFPRNLEGSKRILLSSSFSHVDRSNSECSSRKKCSRRLNLSSGKLRVIRAGPPLLAWVKGGGELTLDADLMIDVRGIMSLDLLGAVASDGY